MPQRPARSCVQTAMVTGVLFLLLVAPIQAEEARGSEAPKENDVPPAAQVGLLLEGRLGLRTVTQGGARKTLYSIRIGTVDYELTIAGLDADALRKAKNKYVSIRSVPKKPVREGANGLVLTGKTTFEVQAATPLVGVVRKVRTGKQGGYALERSDGLWNIAPKDARKFKKFEGMQVAATCFRVTDGRYRALEGVKQVERRLRPGERAPRTGEAAIATSWKGTLTALKVPKGIPGVKPGDFALQFQADATLKTANGRVMNSYDIVGVRVRKFVRKKRSAKIELSYSFGQGSYAILLEGVFAADWKSFSGTWKSGFLGSGDFHIAVVAEK